MTSDRRTAASVKVCGCRPHDGGAAHTGCPCRKPHPAGERPRIGRCCCVMRDLCRLIGWMVVDLLRSRVALEAEIWMLRQQINVLRRTAPKKHAFSAFDRLVFVGLYRLFPEVCDVLAIVKPETIVRWHRAGFRLYWRWKSRRRGGRADGTARDTPADPPDEHYQSAVGRAPDPR